MVMGICYMIKCKEYLSKKKRHFLSFSHQPVVSWLQSEKLPNMSEPPGIVLQTIQWICLGIWRQSFFSMFTFTDTDSTLYIWYSSLKLNTIDIVCKILKYVHLYKSFKFFCMYKILQTHVADMLNKYKYCILVPLSLSSMSKKNCSGICSKVYKYDKVKNSFNML